MRKPLSLLIVEDCEDDALLVLMCLRRAGFEPSWKRVDTEPALAAALDQQPWDLLISDHNMPEFSAPAALAHVRGRGLDVPFIIVSGSIGEEAAVLAMKAGAQDYMVKGHLGRLPAAVERELRDAQERRARREAEQRIRHMAYYDQLTGLPNRASFREGLDKLLRDHGQSGEPLAVITVKLDSLQEVNNTLGHQTGERVLCDVSARLRAALGEQRLLARLGSDQFALAVADGDVEHALRLARDILHAIATPVRIDAIEVEVAALAGIALFPGHGETTDLLLRRADVALVQAMESHGRVALYDRDRDPYQPERLALIAELRRAIEAGQLTVHYQPKVNMATGTLTGVEALVRWDHPRLGQLPPDRFIPLAEQTGSINALTRWVLREAMRQAYAWHRTGLDLSIAVNLSAKNLQNTELTDQLGRLLSSSGMPADKLVLEVTESAIMTDEPRVKDLLVRLSEQGVEIAIDDFGTGYSSFANLRRLPVSEIKIDKSFVLNMVSSEEDRMIVSSIVELGHNLGLSVVAEGVENDSTWDVLAGMHCDLAQGYYLSRPLPAAALLDWSRGFSSRPPPRSGEPRWADEGAPR
jgi:diguanylate cyclase (GGDEF)-like protein